MSTTNRLVSKVLLLDARDDQLQSLARVCEELNVIGIPVRNEDLAAALAEHTDLGAVLLAGSYDGPKAAETIAARLHALRPELPVIVEQREPGGWPAALTQLRARCALNDPRSLGSALAELVGGAAFPDALVDGIVEITTARLASLFPSQEIVVDPPSIVRDRIIFGEVFSLIPLEGAWCRGYMLMQAEEEPLLAMLERGRDDDGSADFREVNSALGELTNLVWGAFKNRYLSEPATGMQPLVQVPLIINHRHRYISFGSDNPQLCFRYRLRNPGTHPEIVIDQRFVFSLSWAPEHFDERSDEGSAAFGEIDLF